MVSYSSGGSSSSTNSGGYSPGAYGNDWSNGYLGAVWQNLTGEGLYDQSSKYTDQLASTINNVNPYTSAIQDVTLNGGSIPYTSAEQSVLNDLMDVTAGRASVRGLGSPTQTALAQSVAPQLVTTRQNYVNNLLNASTDWRTGNTSTEEALFNLIKLVMPTYQSGSTATSSSSGGSGWGIYSSSSGTKAADTSSKGTTASDVYSG